MRRSRSAPAAFVQIVGKQIGFFGGVVSCAIGLVVLRMWVAPADAPDAGPTRSEHEPSLTPVGGD